MDCMKAQKLIRPYLEGQLSDRELEAFLDHVENCRECHDELEIYFSIYRTLGDEDDDGDYNFTRKLERKLRDSRKYLKRRHISKFLRIFAVALAEAFFLAAASGLARDCIGEWTEHFQYEEETEAAAQTATEAATETAMEAATETAMEAATETEEKL